MVVKTDGGIVIKTLLKAIVRCAPHSLRSRFERTNLSLCSEQKAGFRYLQSVAVEGEIGQSAAGAVSSLPLPP